MSPYFRFINGNDLFRSLKKYDVRIYSGRDLSISFEEIPYSEGWSKYYLTILYNFNIWICVEIVINNEGILILKKKYNECAHHQYFEIQKIIDHISKGLVGLPEQTHFFISTLDSDDIDYFKNCIQLHNNSRGGKQLLSEQYMSFSYGIQNENIETILGCSMFLPVIKELLYSEDLKTRTNAILVVENLIRFPQIFCSIMNQDIFNHLSSVCDETNHYIGHFQACAQRILEYYHIRLSYIMLFEGLPPTITNISDINILRYLNDEGILHEVCSFVGIV